MVSAGITRPLSPSSFNCPKPERWNLHRQTTAIPPTPAPGLLSVPGRGKPKSIIACSTPNGSLSPRGSFCTFPGQQKLLLFWFISWIFVTPGLFLPSTVSHRGGGCQGCARHGRPSSGHVPPQHLALWCLCVPQPTSDRRATQLVYLLKK